MTISILQIRPEELDTSEKRAQFTISVIGCEPHAILQACLFANAGFKVICAEADQSKISLLAKGKVPFSTGETEIKLKNHLKTGRIIVTSDIKAAASQSNIIAITTPVGIDEKKKPTYLHLENVCKQIGASLCRDSLVLVMSIARLDSVEGKLKEILENESGLKVGNDLGLAYSPISSFNGRSLGIMANSERIVASADKTSLIAASTILETSLKNRVKKVKNVKTAAAATLFEAVQHDITVALANEFAVFCEKAGIDYSEILELSTKQLTKTASLSWVMDPRTDEEPYLLLDDADDLNVKLRIASVAREINEGMARHVAMLVKNSLMTCRKTIRRARVSILGASQSQDATDKPKRMTGELTKALEAKGAKVSIYDPYFSEIEKAELQRYHRKSLTEAVEGADCIVIVTGHDQFRRLNLKRVKALMKTPAVIVDVEGILEPDKVEKEGFTYQRLGRGVSAK